MVSEDQNSYTYQYALSDLGAPKQLILLQVIDRDGAINVREWEVNTRSDNIASLPISQDTYLDKSTYKAMGTRDYLKTTGPIYLKLIPDNELSAEDITTARLLMYSQKQYGELHLGSFQAPNDWHEGLHDRSGATREFKSYERRNAWRNYLGDWSGFNNQMNAEAGYEYTILPRSNEEKFVEIDVTEALKAQWTRSVIDLALVSNGVSHIFSSKEHAQREQRPKVIITTNGFVPGENDDQNSPIILPPVAPPISNDLPVLKHISEAINMNDGSWANLATNLTTADMHVAANEKTLHIAGWTDDAMWDENNKQLYFMGFRQNLKMLNFDSQTNEWREIAADIEWPIETNFGHVYGNNAYNANEGLFYHHMANTKEVYSFNTASEQWTKLPTLPLESGELGTSIEYFPELGGLVRVARSGIKLLANGKDQWQSIGFIPKMGYHSLVRYNPIRQEMLIAGGNYAPNSFYILSKSGEMFALDGLTSKIYDIESKRFIAPEEELNLQAALSMSIRADKLVVNPSNGNYLIFTDKKVFELDPELRTLTWYKNEQWPFTPYEKPIATTIFSDNVILFADRQVLLYRPPKIKKEEEKISVNLYQ